MLWVTIHCFLWFVRLCRICGHFQNKPYKTASRFLPNLTIHGEHHTEQNQNRKWINKNNIFFTLCHHTFENPFLLLLLITLSLSPFSPQYWQFSVTSHYSQYLSMKQVIPKPLSHKLFPYFFLINSLKSVSTFKTKIFFNETWYFWL